MSSLYFIVGNLKINPFILGDAPLPGFNLLTWDSYTYTEGTLWKLDIDDASFTKIGIDKVYGQLWKAEESTEIRFLEECVGLNKGLCYPIEVDVTVEIDQLDKSKLKATTFALEKISPKYEMIRSGRWRF